MLIGTPQYMSPEQAKGKNQSVDQRTDIFALGAIVYEMLSGRAAFSGDSVVSVILDVVQGTPAPLASLVPSLPPAVVAAVERALAKQPAERFQDVGDFIQALTGRPLDTLGQARAPDAAANPSSNPHRPLSAEEVMGATQASSPGLASEAPPPTTVTATAHRTPGTSGPGPGPAARGPRWPLFAGLGTVLMVAAAGLLFARRPGPPPAETVAAAVTPPPPKTEPSAAADPTVTVPPEPVVVPEAAKPETSTGDEKSEKEPEPALPREAAEHLREAERLLERGDASEAIRRARQSFFVRKSNRGWALLTRAFCRKGDLENARASFRNIRRGSPDRAKALRACRTADIDLR